MLFLTTPVTRTITAPWENADEQIELNNPTCGDVITLQLAMDGDTITAAKFSGHGCSISTASASMMTDVVIGKTKTEAVALAEEFSCWSRTKSSRMKTPWRSDRPERRRKIPCPHQMRHFGLEGFGKSNYPGQKKKGKNKRNPRMKERLYE